MQTQDLVAKRQRPSREPAPKPEVNAERANEIWSWDLSYLRLGEVFVYLFAIIDVYSRKIVGWHLSENATVAEMKKAWDKALCSEGLMDTEVAPQMPIALSDHGVQMAKKSAKQFFRDLGVKQLFARYQTPQDNAWIESWFRILKYDWLRFKDYITFGELEEILRNFIHTYNTLRYHGSIGYVTTRTETHGPGQASPCPPEPEEERGKAKAVGFSS
jgi:putative transposase